MAQTSERLTHPTDQQLEEFREKISGQRSAVVEQIHELKDELRANSRSAENELDQIHGAPVVDTDVFARMLDPQQAILDAMDRALKRIEDKNLRNLQGDRKAHRH